jgi:CRP/FNR family transcriptional regulator
MRNPRRTERILAAIRSQDMFRGLTAELLDRIAGFAVLRDCARGNVVWEEGDPADHLTLIVQGRVKIVKHAEAGDVILEIFGAGEPVGAIAVYNEMPYPAAAVCLEPATLLLLPRGEYFDLLEREPRLARALIRNLTRIMLVLTRKLEEMRGQRVDVRIAQLFLSLADRMGRETPEGVEIPLHLSRQEVAEMVGTTVETAIRILSRWGREGLLITEAKRFVIPSRDRLREAAGGGEAGVSCP